MIIEKLQDTENLTSTEQAIAKYILDENNDIDNLTLQQLGEKSYTSQTAVFRLYKKLGLNSYREFMSILQLERNEYFKYKDIYKENPHHYFTSLDDIVKVLNYVYVDTLKRNSKLYDENVINRVCNRIQSADFVDIYGIGISDTLAKQLAFKLQTLGIPCHYQNGSNNMYLRRLTKKDGHIALFISQTGKNELLIRIAKLLREKGIYTATITGNRNNTLAKTCQDSIVFDMNGFDDIDTMIGPLSADFTINVIYATLMHRYQMKKYEGTQK